MAKTVYVVCADNGSGMEATEPTPDFLEARAAFIRLRNDNPLAFYRIVRRTVEVEQ